VVSCTISQSPPPPKRSKKGSAPSPKEPVLEVILHDTVLFPEGGGQPSDIGHITATSNGQTYDVTEVKRAGGHAIHYVRMINADSDMLALSPGTEVGVKLGDDGFNRRYDHVSHHACELANSF
jgi:misacylated tRNA(Ala) deacylase